MNKKRLEEFANYIEAFTQRIADRFPDCVKFINGEPKEMLERFPELPIQQQPQRDRQSLAIVKITLTSSYDKERRKTTLVLNMN